VCVEGRLASPEKAVKEIQQSKKQPQSQTRIMAEVQRDIFDFDRFSYKYYRK